MVIVIGGVVVIGVVIAIAQATKMVSLEKLAARRCSITLYPLSRKPPLKFARAGGRATLRVVR